MKNRTSFALGMLTALFLVCLPAAALSQTTQEAKLANAKAHGKGVTWDVAAQHSGLTLTVAAPDGRVFRKEFKAGDSPEFTLTDKQGEKLPDGPYTYEIRLSPVLSSQAKATLAKARGKDDDPEDTRATRKPGTPAQPLVESGSFSILNGAVIVAGGVEPEAPRPNTKSTQQSRVSGATAAAVSKLRQHHLSSIALRVPAFTPDEVIPDDLIVQGSECVGLDCVSGEVFGFDTIRLKENNTRIQFDDTSTSAGYPTNNWQIRANSSASGGASFLAFLDQGTTGNSETGTIVFEVDAGAPANSLKVSSNGKVGLRTATPVLDLHITTSDTPAHRFEQTSAGGFTAQTWDVAGNEANFFVRDVTGGSRLPFRIRPGAPTSSIDISASGDVGIGTASPLARFHVFSSATSDVNGGFGPDPSAGPAMNFGYSGASFGRGSGFFNVRPDASAAAPNPSLRFLTVNVERMIVTNAGNVGIATSAPTDTLSVNGTASKPGGGSWAVFSDERLKTIKGRFNSGLKAVMQLQPLRYEYKGNNALDIRSGGEHVGFGAQAVQKIVPEAVTRSDNGYLQINNDPILWTMLNAIKEQQAQIQQLQEEVRQLRARGKRRK